MISKIMLIVFLALASNLTFAKCEMDGACDSAEECKGLGEDGHFKDSKCIRIAGSQAASTDCAQVADGAHGKGAASGSKGEDGKSSSKSK